MINYEYQSETYNVCAKNEQKELYKQAINIYGDKSLYIVDEGSYVHNGKTHLNEGSFSLRKAGKQDSDITGFWRVLDKLKAYYNGGVKVYWGENMIHQDGQNIDCQNINVIPDRAVGFLYRDQFGREPECDILEQKMQLAATGRLAISMVNQENIGLSKDQLISFYYV